MLPLVLIVDTSEKFGSEDWLRNLRFLFCEATSLIDNTLHQLYFCAQYTPRPGWNFNPEKLGPRHGQRIVDKLKWIYAITGKHLDCKDEVEAFKRIKGLRNHFSHFDPPCFCLTLEDVAGWLDDVILVAQLNWGIRRCAGSPLCPELIDLLLQPQVEFVPMSSPKSSEKRMPQPSTMGYGSTSSERLASVEASKVEE